MGAIVGTLNAATGVGWGIIVIPVLFLIPALTPRQAVAVSLLAYLFNSLVASFENVRSGLIVWRYAVYLSAGDAQHHANHPVRRQSLFPVPQGGRSGFDLMFQADIVGVSTSIDR